MNENCSLADVVEEGMNGREKKFREFCGKRNIFAPPYSINMVA
jgi:hypothetical protein